MQKLSFLELGLFALSLQPVGFMSAQDHPVGPQQGLCTPKTMKTTPKDPWQSPKKKNPTQDHPGISQQTLDHTSRVYSHPKRPQEGCNLGKPPRQGLWAPKATLTGFINIQHHPNSHQKQTIPTTQGWQTLNTTPIGFNHTQDESNRILQSPKITQTGFMNTRDHLGVVIGLAV